MPAGVNAVGFDIGVNYGGGFTTQNVEIIIVTADGEQSFTVPVTGTGTGGAFRVVPQFAGFLSSHPITAVRFRIPTTRSDAFLILDDFSFGQIAAPVINLTSGVVNGASFAATIAPNTWITIFGKVLSVPTRPWKGDDFVGVGLPTQIENVSVTIGGRPAYVYYISPTQVNVLTRSDLPEGAAIVEVTRDGVKSEPVTVQVQHVAPALFMFDPENRRYAAATHVDNTLVGKTSLYEGASTPAHPGEVITLWGAGFGRTDPAIPEGEIASGGRPLIAQPVVTIGNVRADVLFAGLTAAGLYQFNVRVPDSLPDGDQPVAILVEGSTTQENAFVTVQR